MDLGSGSPRRRVRAIALAIAVVLVTATSWTLLVRQELIEIQRQKAEAEAVIELDLGLPSSSQRPAYTLAAEPRPLRLRITVDPRDLDSPVEIVLRDANGSEGWRGPAKQLQSEPQLELSLAQGLPPGAYELEVLTLPPTGQPTSIGYAYFDLEAH